MSAVKTLVKHSVWLALLVLRRKAIVPLRVRSGPAAGAILNLDVRSQAAYWRGSYDEYVFARIPFGRYLKAGDVAWDCGAFVGYYTAVFRRWVGDSGKVVVFEASAKNYRPLAEIPALNRWANVDIRQLAVGGDHTRIDFVGNLGGASGPFARGTRFAPGTALEVESVPCCGVDELVFETGVPPPVFIKFDLESAEELALHNGPRTFTEKRPVILLELHGTAARDAAGRFLETYGYGATQVERLTEINHNDEAEWLGSLRKNAVCTLAELQGLPYIPHMMLVLPREHPDWGFDSPRRANSGGFGRL